MTERRQITFAVTQPLGRLAKWLRLLGFDTLYEPEVSAVVFKERCRKGILLTRSKQSVASEEAPALIYIKADQLSLQLRTLALAMLLKSVDLNPFSRCIRCNAPIEKVNKTALKSMVPDYIWETHQNFSRCTQCHRIYWPGSHTDRSRKMIQQMIDSHDPKIHESTR